MRMQDKCPARSKCRRPLTSDLPILSEHPSGLDIACIRALCYLLGSPMENEYFAVECSGDVIQSEAEQVILESDQSLQIVMLTAIQFDEHIPRVRAVDVPCPKPT